MTDTLVDTNIIIDLTGRDAIWLDWSRKRLAEARDDGAIVVNQIIYAELTAGFARREEIDEALNDAGFRLESLPRDAAFAAGLAHLARRREKRLPRTPLPDFYIGAHAAVRRYRLLTRDRGYYAAFFPTVDLVKPETHP